MQDKSKEFVRKAIAIHGCRYDYSQSEYVNSRTKIKIICPEHGEFFQTPHNHLKGNGCPKCGRLKSDRSRTYDTGKFIDKARLIHNEKYDYSKTEYKGWNIPVRIICPEHGEFMQIPSNHLNGRGCPECANEKRKKSEMMTTETFIEHSKAVHGDKYSYEECVYSGSHSKVIIECKKHGRFKQAPDNHLRGQGCPKCGKTTSRPEEEIIEILKELNPVQRERTILSGGKEIDVYIPSLKTGIEYNGLRWHSEAFGKDKNYHMEKLEECRKKEIRLIQIFEDEWINHKEICVSKIKQICGINTNDKVYARKCTVKEIKDKHEAYDFLDKNHIQGRTGFTVAIGAFNNEELVGVMTFKRENDNTWELNRFATDINLRCIGIGGKLFRYFTMNYEYREVKSFADRRWTINENNNLYTKIGFKVESFVRPTYTYFNTDSSEPIRYHKFGFRKKRMDKKYGETEGLTEKEIAEREGFSRIWDCGLIKYTFSTK